MEKNDIQAGDFTSKHKQRWFLIGQICLSLSCGKIQAKKNHQKTPTYSRKKFLSDALFIDLFFMPSSKKKGHIALLLCVVRFGPLMVTKYI